MNLLKQKFLFAIVVVFCGFLLASPGGVTQARGLVPCGGYTDSGKAEPACKFSDIFVIIARVTNWLIAVAGLYAVFQIIVGAFWLVVSQGNEEAISAKKKHITTAIIGMVLAFMAFMLINTVVNFILASQTPGKTVDLTKPLCYLNPGGPDCVK